MASNHKRRLKRPHFPSLPLFGTPNWLPLFSLVERHTFSNLPHSPALLFLFFFFIPYIVWIEPMTTETRRERKKYIESKTKRLSDQVKHLNMQINFFFLFFFLSRLIISSFIYFFSILFRSIFIPATHFPPHNKWIVLSFTLEARIQEKTGQKK